MENNKSTEEQEGSKFSKSLTRLQDNHGVVVSGSGNVLHIHFDANGMSVKGGKSKIEKETAKEKLCQMMMGWNSGRMKFCVLRAIVLSGKAANLYEADKKLKLLYDDNVPGKAYDVEEIEHKLNVLSMKHECKKWNLDDSPFKDPNTFDEYRFNTQTIIELITNSDLIE